MVKSQTFTVIVNEFKRNIRDQLIFILAMIFVLVFLNHSYIAEYLIHQGTASENFDTFIGMFVSIAVFIAAISSITFSLDYERGYVKFLLSLAVPKYSLLVAKLFSAFLISLFFYSFFVLEYVAIFSAMGAPLGDTMLLCIFISYIAVSVVLLLATAIGLLTSVVFKKGIKSITITIILLILWIAMPGPLAEQIITTVVINDFKEVIRLYILSPEPFLFSCLRYVNINNPYMLYEKEYFFIASIIGFIVLSLVTVLLFVCSLLLFRRVEVY